MFQNTIFVMTSSLDSFLISQFSPWVRGLVVVPGHLFPALVISLGVVQMYTVKRRTRDAIGMLMIHFWIAVLMFTSFNWLINLTGIVSDLQSYTVCIFLSLFVNPAIFAFFYWKWKRERHYPELPDQLPLPRIITRSRISRIDNKQLEEEEESTDNKDSDSKSEKSNPNHSDDSSSSDESPPGATIHNDVELTKVN